jgi:hypothetical protein
VALPNDQIEKPLGALFPMKNLPVANRQYSQAGLMSFRPSGVTG